MLKIAKVQNNTTSYAHVVAYCVLNRSDQFAECKTKLIIS